MKKLCVIVALLAGNFSFGQKVNFGIKAGTNLSSFAGNTYNQLEQNMKIGYYGGVYAGLWTAKHFCLQPEVLYSVQGGKTVAGGIEVDNKISYIAVPVMVKFKTDNFYFEVGPQAAFRIQASANKTDIKNSVNSTDFSLAGGVGYQSKYGVGISARYLHGLTHVGKIDPSSGTPNFTNQVFQFGLFYAFKAAK